MYVCRTLTCTSPPTPYPPPPHPSEVSCVPTAPALRMHHAAMIDL